jgi:hypothetical protein
MVFRVESILDSPAILEIERQSPANKFRSGRKRVVIMECFRQFSDFDPGGSGTQLSISLAFAELIHERREE